MKTLNSTSKLCVAPSGAISAETVLRRGKEKVTAVPFGINTAQGGDKKRQSRIKLVNSRKIQSPSAFSDHTTPVCDFPTETHTILNIRNLMSKIRTDIGKIRMDMTNNQTETVKFRTDVTHICTDMTTIWTEMAKIRTGMTTNRTDLVIQKEISKVRTDMIKIQANMINIRTDSYKKRTKINRIQSETVDNQKINTPSQVNSSQKRMVSFQSL